MACRFGLADLRLAQAVGAELAETEFHGDETIAQQAILGRSDLAETEFHGDETIAQQAILGRSDRR